MQDTQGRDKQDNRIIVNSVQNEEIQSFLVRNKQYKIFTIKDDIVLKATLNLPKIIEGSIPIDTQRQIFYHSSKDILAISDIVLFELQEWLQYVDYDTLRISP